MELGRSNFWYTPIMETTETIKVISKLQKTSVEVFKVIARSLKIGINEQDIAELIRLEFKKRNIVDFWYDVPIIVLVGTKRFINGANSDYATKSPSRASTLKEGDTIYIDLHPQDSKTRLWGDWNMMVVFHPRKGIDDEQVAFLKEMQEIHREGITKFTPAMTGANIINYYFDTYKKRGITPLIGKKPDVGHTIHAGLKVNANRLLLTAKNATPIGGYIYAIEPGGSRSKKSGEGLVVGRFEECVYIPKEGTAVLLGNQEFLPTII